MNDTTYANEAFPKGSLKVAPVGKRIIAFGMDYILLGFLSLLIFFYLPRFLGEQSAKEFSNLITELKYLFGQPDPNEEELRSLLQETARFYQRLNFDFIIFNFYMLYFFIGEFFFSGRSIGKATFSIYTRTAEDHEELSKYQMIIRSFIKSLTCAYALYFWIINFCIFLYNRKCFHDILTNSTSVYVIESEKKAGSFLHE